jgi:hypothetical protein
VSEGNAVVAATAGTAAAGRGGAGASGTAGVGASGATGVAPAAAAGAGVLCASPPLLFLFLFFLLIYLDLI